LDKSGLLAFLIILICLFSHLGALGLVGPDEPRYAWIAREMATTGDWITPRLYGAPWFEKPVLYYWAAAIGFRLHLASEWAARLPSAIAALISALAIGWLGWKQSGTGASGLKSPALLAPLLFSSSVATIGFARAGGPDMLFTAALTCAMATAATVLQGRHLQGGGPVTSGATNSIPLLILFGVSLGSAVLAKGPAGIILAGGAIGLWAITTGSWTGAFSFVHPVAIISFCIISLPWYILCAIRNPDFLRVFILEHNFNRYLTPAFQHPQPIWFFPIIVVLGILPWSGFLWELGKDSLRSIREQAWRNSSEVFLACWVVFPVLFFSFSKSKLPGYILPSFPPLALLLALFLSRSKEGERSAHRSSAIILGITWLALGISTQLWLRRLSGVAREAVHSPIFKLEIFVLVAGAAMLAIGTFRKRGVIVLSLLVVAVLVEFAGLRIMTALDPYLSARTYGELLQQDRRPDRIFTYRVSRSWNFGLSFYLHREIREWTPDDPEAALILTSRSGEAELEKLGRFRGPIEGADSGNFLVPVLPSPHQ
jgi:4-amino-4-deoxy-L-arabinose transferase-like glycosyltransferase